MRNGYQQTTLTKVFDDLYAFALTKKPDAVLYSGDIDMVAGILSKLISHMKAFPQLTLLSRQIEAKVCELLFNLIEHRFISKCVPFTSTQEILQISI